MATMLSAEDKKTDGRRVIPSMFPFFQGKTVRFIAFVCQDTLVVQKHSLTLRPPSTFPLPLFGPLLPLPRRGDA